jgi:hypothetical protein
MKRTMVWTMVLAAFLLFGATAPVKAMPAGEAKLSALYNAIFTVSDADPAEPAPGDPVDPDSDALAENVYCCTQAGSCIKTTAAKCVSSPYNGIVCVSIPDCRANHCTG